MYFNELFEIIICADYMDKNCKGSFQNIDLNQINLIEMIINDANLRLDLNIRQR